MRGCAGGVVVFLTVFVDNGSLITDYRMDGCQSEQGHAHIRPALPAKQASEKKSEGTFNTTAA